jgi:hypothetical protein
MATAFPPPPGDGSQPPAQYQAPQAPQGQYPPQGQYAPAPGYGQPYGTPPSKNNGLAITSLVLGIVALITVWLPPLAIVIALVGVVLGFLGMRKAAESGGRGLAIGGLITSGLALLASIVLLVLAALVFNAADDELDDWEDEINEINEQLEEDLQNLDTEG